MILFCCHLQINKLQGELASARCMVVMHVPAWFYFRDQVSICNPEEALISGSGSWAITLPLQLSLAFSTGCPAACLAVPSEPGPGCSLQALSVLSCRRLPWGIVWGTIGKWLSRSVADLMSYSCLVKSCFRSSERTPEGSEALLGSVDFFFVCFFPGSQRSPTNRYFLLPVHRVLQVPMLVLGMCTNGRGGTVWYICGTHGCIFQKLRSATGNSAPILFFYLLFFAYPLSFLFLFTQLTLFPLPCLLP